MFTRTINLYRYCRDFSSWLSLEKRRLDACDFCVRIRNITSSSTVPDNIKKLLRRMLENHHKEEDNRRKAYQKDLNLNDNDEHLGVI